MSAAFVRHLAQELPPAPAATPEIVLGLDFFVDTAVLLEYAENRLLEGESLDLDEIATMIAAHVRPNLRVVYAHLETR